MMLQVFPRRAQARRSHASRSLSTLTSVVVGAALLTACGSDTPTATTPQPPRGMLVLDGFIQPGITFVGDTGTATTKVNFGPTTEFDAGGFSLLRDTVLAVSSRGAGDLLYILDVNTSAVRKLQMPTRSNPGRARLFAGSSGQRVIAVALRDSSAVLLHVLQGTNTSTVQHANAGTCPVDMFQYGSDIWVVDANANCRVNYAVQGEMRLIRISATGTTRDTILLPGLRGSSGSAIVQGEVAYVSAGGQANFATNPFTLVASGAIAKVDLRNRRVMTTKSMPAGTYGAGVKLGLDGFLYASISENLTTFTSRVVKVRTDDLSFVTNGANPWLTLTNSSGAAVTCGSAQADALGRLHCIVNGTGSVTSLLVFNTQYVETRRVQAGQGGVDLAIR
jgi:hypothetical protein